MVPPARATPAHHDATTVCRSATHVIMGGRERRPLPTTLPLALSWNPHLQTNYLCPAPGRNSRKIKPPGTSTINTSMTLFASPSYYRNMPLPRCQETFVASPAITISLTNEKARVELSATRIP